MHCGVIHCIHWLFIRVASTPLAIMRHDAPHAVGLYTYVTPSLRDQWPGSAGQVLAEVAGDWVHDLHIAQHAGLWQWLTLQWDRLISCVVRRCADWPLTASLRSLTMIVRRASVYRYVVLTPRSCTRRSSAAVSAHPARMWRGLWAQCQSLSLDSDHSDVDVFDQLYLYFRVKTNTTYIP